MAPSYLGSAVLLSAAATVGSEHAPESAFSLKMRLLLRADGNIPSNPGAVGALPHQLGHRGGDTVPYLGEQSELFISYYVLAPVCEEARGLRGLRGCATTTGAASAGTVRMGGLLQKTLALPGNCSPHHSRERMAFRVEVTAQPRSRRPVEAAYPCTGGQSSGLLKPEGPVWGP